MKSILTLNSVKVMYDKDSHLSPRRGNFNRPPALPHFFALAVSLFFVECGKHPTFEVIGDESFEDETEEQDTGSGTEGDTETGTATGDDEQLDTDTDEQLDTETDTTCPWKCEPIHVESDGYFSCDDTFQEGNTPKWVHNWSFECQPNYICCEPLIDQTHCNDHDDTECTMNDCDIGQNTDRYCNGALYRCCQTH